MRTERTRHNGGVTTDAEYLKDRYGAPRSDQRLTWIVAGFAAVLVLAWFIWQAFTLNQPSITWSEAGLTIVSDSQVDVNFNVSTEVGSTVTCTVRAYTENTTEVGVKDVTIGPVTSEETGVSVSVATIQPATGARVTDCRFTSE